jgi:hypothetical protein
MKCTECFEELREGKKAYVMVVIWFKNKRSTKIDKSNKEYRSLWN